MLSTSAVSIPMAGQNKELFTGVKLDWVDWRKRHQNWDVWLMDQKFQMGLSPNMISDSDISSDVNIEYLVERRMENCHVWRLV